MSQYLLGSVLGDTASLFCCRVTWAVLCTKCCYTVLTDVETESSLFKRWCSLLIHSVCPVEVTASEAGQLSMAVKVCQSCSTGGGDIIKYFCNKRPFGWEGRHFFFFFNSLMYCFPVADCWPLFSSVFHQQLCEVHLFWLSRCEDFIAFQWQLASSVMPPSGEIYQFDSIYNLSLS